MSKAILRVSGIKTTSDLRGIGKHNVDRKSETNMDIDHARSDENITLKNCSGNYNLMFDEITKDLKKQHEEQMKTTRKSRQKKFNDKINGDKADVACEFLMSATPDFFKDKSRDEIHEWAENSLDFITDEIGINKENILHAVVHMDEKTPHLHVVAVPLVEKYDGRRKKDVLAISRKHFIKTRDDMSEIQTKYVKHLNEKGFNLERGLEKSGAKHLDVARYKVHATQQELSAAKKDLLEKKNELKEVNATLDKSFEILSDTKVETPFLKKETEIEIVKRGFLKKEELEKETGNYVLSPEQYKEIVEKVNAAVVIKDDYERLKNTDYVKENERIKEIARKGLNYAKELEKRNEGLKKEYTKLFWENDLLKDQISDIRRDVKLIYQSTKEFFKGHAKDVSAFKTIFKAFVDKVKDKTSEFQERHNLEPKMNEFEKVDKQVKNKERDHGLER